jgi:two-component sensor histidine kinase
MRKTSDERTVELFRASRSRVRVIALFHAVAGRGGMRGPSADDTRAYLTEIVREAERARATDGRVRVELETGGVMLGLAEVVPAGLVVNELVTNALAYAFPDRRRGSVRVTLAWSDGGRDVLLRVADDGIGLASGREDSGGLGLPLVRMLAEQLSAELAQSSSEGRGADFCLRFRSTQESHAWPTS